MPDPRLNLAVSTVATAPSPATSGTSLVVASGHGARFPAPATDGAYNLMICPAGALPDPSNSEIVRCTARSTDTFTIARTQESTSARTVVVGDLVFLAPTALNWAQLETSKAARYPKVVFTIDPNDIPTQRATVANEAYGYRVALPETGTITHMAAYITTAGAGNFDIGIYDTTVTTRNRLRSTGAVAVGGTGWRAVVLTSSLNVLAGDQVDFAVSFSLNTATLGAGGATSANVLNLPSGWMPVPLGGTPKLGWRAATSHPLPTTITEANLLDDSGWTVAIAAKYS